MSSTARSGRSRRRRSATRRDLQGLRGMGVILVVVGHLWRWPPGVYAALDIFFVLSGFLITGILIDSFAKYGRIYFIPFYLSRLRRLMPTAIVVILVTIGLFYLLFSPARGDAVAVDGLWAFLLVVNWHFAVSGTDYFSDQTESPLLHYWSLSIEEQFYAFWPLMLLGFLVVARRRSYRPERFLLVALGLVTALSFAYSMWHSVNAPTQAYYSTFDRVWEFGVGGLLAAARPQLARLPARAGQVLGWVGALGLWVPVFVLTYGVAFPAPWALPSVLLTGAVIAGGVGRSTSHLVHLDNRAMVYVGNISYSVYLWHLPINLLLKPYFDAGVAGYYVAAVALTAVVSVTSYHLLEHPMRYARGLMTPPERERLAKRPKDFTRVKYGWAAVASATFVGLCLIAVNPPATTAAAGARPGGAPRVAAGQGESSVTIPALERQESRLADSLEQTEFPELVPPLRSIDPANWAAGHAEIGCIAVGSDSLEQCRFGPDGATKEAVVVGDSVGLAWMPGIRAALEPRGWAVQQLTLPICGTWTLPSYVYADGTPFPGCRDHHELVEEVVERNKPDLVILTSAAAQVQNARRRGFLSDPALVAERGLRTTIDRLTSPAGRIVVLSPPPVAGNPLECVTRFGTPSDCVTSPGRDWYQHVSGEKEAAALTGARFVDTEPWFCLQGACPEIVGNTLVTLDGTHLSVQYSRQLAPLLGHAILAE